MIITVTYRIDADLYRTDTKHDASLTTTEYIYRNDMLIHQQIGKNLGIRINNRFRHVFRQDFSMPNEQYLFKKTYSRSAAKPITKSTFEEKLKRFDTSQTAIEKEIIEEYAYIGKNNAAEEVQIMITEKHGVMTASINFTGAEQHGNFIAPKWLIPPNK